MKIFCIILSLSAFVAVTHSKKIPTGNGVQQLLDQGFQSGGSFTPEGSSSGFGIASANSMSLWLSPDKKSQSAAITQCKQFGGELVYILNQNQDYQVRDFLLETGTFEPVWTSAIYDSPASNWYWLPIDTLATFYNNLGPGCNRASGYGVFTQYALSNYKWCSSRTSTALKYVCVV